ncbi:dual specificity protein phosphatase [Pelomyxa schiedti]|nr:dual specificity protein phosphatase [Pelomyxa schiedti]
MTTRTSDTHPIYANLVPLPANVSGKMGLTLAPGKVQTGSMTGVNWERDVLKDLTTLKNAYGTSVLVTLMEPFEMANIKISHLFTTAESIGIKSIHWPLPDGSAPTSQTLPGYVELVSSIIQHLKDGRTVVIHCLGGLGRTGTLAACVLLALRGPEGGFNGQKAIAVIRAARTGSVENPAQEHFVSSFELIAWGLHTKFFP